MSPESHGVCADAGEWMRLTQLSCLTKRSRSPLHRAAASPLQQLRTLSKLSALKMFWKRWCKVPFELILG